MGGKIVFFGKNTCKDIEILNDVDIYTDGANVVARDTSIAHVEKGRLILQDNSIGFITKGTKAICLDDSLCFAWGNYSMYLHDNSTGVFFSDSPETISEHNSNVVKINPCVDKEKRECTNFKLLHQYLSNLSSKTEDLNFGLIESTKTKGRLLTVKGLHNLLWFVDIFKRKDVKFNIFMVSAGEPILSKNIRIHLDNKKYLYTISQYDMVCTLMTKVGSYENRKITFN